MIDPDEDPVEQILARSFGRWLEHLRSGDPAFAEASGSYPSDMSEWQSAVYLPHRLRSSMGRGGAKGARRPIDRAGDPRARPRRQTHVRSQRRSHARLPADGAVAEAVVSTLACACRLVLASRHDQNQSTPSPNPHRDDRAHRQDPQSAHPPRGVHQGPARQGAQSTGAKAALDPRKGRIMRRSIITTAALAAWLAFAGSASAAPFTGPWDSAHQPTTVTNPNVTSALPTVLDSADLGACGPQPRTTAVVTFSDPSGWASETFTSTTVIEGLYYCLAATETQSGNIDFTLASYDGLGEVIFTPVTTTNNASAPFVWTVSNASGVIAQEADTWIYHTAQTTSFTVDEDKDGIDEFINICINGDHPIYSHNGGDLYCTVTNPTPAGTSVSPGGWPAPPSHRHPRQRLPLILLT
jgi:hypothetical protein